MTITIEGTLFHSAAVWNQNGDHPNDYVGDTDGLENGEMRKFSAEHRKDNDWEGGVVRRYRHPDLASWNVCPHCGRKFERHGWLDKEDQVVCPGDVVITTFNNSTEPTYSALKPNVFEAILPGFSLFCTVATPE